MIKNVDDGDEDSLIVSRECLAPSVQRFMRTKSTVVRC